MRQMILACAILASLCAKSLGETKTFNATSGNWSNGLNWLPAGHGKPVDGDDAIIPSGKTCTIDANEACDSIDVDGTLEFEREEYSLTIDSNSRIDGALRMSPGGTLIIKGALTIDGTGEITMSDVDNALINGYDSNAHLTLEGDCGTDPLDPDCAIDVHGVGTINARLTNNAFVIGESCPVGGGTGSGMVLATNLKDGTGIWAADHCEGLLVVDVEVDGAGDWYIGTSLFPFGGPKTTIRFNVPCLDLTGGFFLTDGEVEVNASICTTGSLLLHDDTSDPVITVAPLKNAYFSGTCGQ